jgi:hypothetical protein
VRVVSLFILLGELPLGSSVGRQQGRVGNAGIVAVGADRRLAAAAAELRMLTLLLVPLALPVVVAAGSDRLRARRAPARGGWGFGLAGVSLVIGGVAG